MRKGTTIHAAVAGRSVPGLSRRVALGAASAALAATALAALPHEQAVERSRPTAAHEALVATASAQIGSDDARYWIDEGATAANPDGGFHARFGAAGATVLRGGTRVRLSPVAIARGAARQSVAMAVPAHHANRVRYARGAVGEWYVNGPAGLEQGFDIARRPLASSAAPLALVISTGARPHKLPDGTVAMGDLTYGRPTVVDATGRSVPAWTAVRRGDILLLTDDRRARYPLTIDPMVQATPKLTPSETLSRGAEFGLNVALSADGSTALVGAARDGGYAGGAWVFTQVGGTWQQQGPKLAPSDPPNGTAQFGFSVAISDDGATAVIGGQAGAVWVFVRTGTAWSQQGPRLAAADPVGSQYFGSSVAVSGTGDTLAVGDPGDATSTGAVWVFTRSGATWTQQGGKLTGSPATQHLGEALSMSTSGDTLLTSGFGRGAWVFTRSGGTWSQDGPVLAPVDGSTNNDFGRSVALSGDATTALVGDDGDDLNHGAAFAFVRGEGGWHQQGPKLVPAGRATGAFAGYSVALSDDGNAALVGADGDFNYRGAAYRFRRDAGAWHADGAAMQPSDAGAPAPDFSSGLDLSGSGDLALIGGENDNQSGAAWIFQVPSLVVSPSLLDFGQVTTGTSRELSTTVTNTNATATGIQETIAGFAAADGFSVVAAPAADGARPNSCVHTAGVADVTLAPGQSCTLYIQFSPTTSGSSGHTFDISVVDHPNDASAPVLASRQLLVSGTGVAPAITSTPLGVDTSTNFAPPPTATITDVAAPAGKGRLGFDAGSSTSAAGTDIANYSWVVKTGGSTIKADCGPGSDSLSGLFLKAGTYDVSLTVTDTAGGRSTSVTQAQLSKATVNAELGGQVAGRATQLTPALACTGNRASLGLSTTGSAQGPSSADCITSWHTKLIHLRSRQNCIDVRYVSEQDANAQASASTKTRAGGFDQPIKLPPGTKLDALGQQATITGPFELNGLIVGGTDRDTATFDSFGHVRAGTRTIYVAGPGASPFAGPGGSRATRSIFGDVEKKVNEFQQKLGKIQLDEDIPRVSTDFETHHCIASAPPGLKLAGLTFATGFCIDFKDDGTYLKVDLKLPAALGGISGSVTLFQDNLAGMHLDEVHLKSERASLFGVIGMKNLHFDYLGRENKWQGGGEMFFPPGGGFEVQVGLVNGTLDYLRLVAEPSPGLPLGEGLFLSKIGIDYRGGSGLAFGGIAGITAATKVNVPLLGNCAILEVTGEFLFTLRPALGYSQHGDADVACIHFGNATFEADVTGRVAFEGEADFKLKVPGIDFVAVEFNAHLGLGFQIPWDAPERLLRGELPDFPRFQADAGVRGEVLGLPIAEAEAVISTDGFGLCGRPFAFAPYMGAGYVINGPNRGFKVMKDSCNIAQFRLQSRSARADLPPGARTLSFPGKPGIGIVGITGADRPPRVLLTGPKGERFETPATLPSVGPDFVAGEYPPERTTYVVIRKPAAGDWTLTPLDGSAPITSVELGVPGPDPVVHAKVVRGAAGFGLKYDLKLGKGQRVRFAEDGPRTSQDLGEASGSAGTIRFTPSEGKPGRRTITALVESDGMPFKRMKVATYYAPGPTPPGRVGALRVVRTGTGVVVRYKAAPGAVLYRIAVSGFGVQRLLETDRTRIRLTDLPTTSALKVTVTALRATTKGQPVRARLAGARPPKLAPVRLRTL